MCSPFRHAHPLLLPHRHQVLWRDLVPLAWQVDASLALSLLDHFPAVLEVKAALQALVVVHASEAEVSVCRRSVAARCVERCVLSAPVDITLAPGASAPLPTGPEPAQGCAAAGDSTRQPSMQRHAAVPARVDARHW